MRMLRPVALLIMAVLLLLIPSPASARSSSMGSLTPVGLDALARCESGNDYTTNTGNGYFGAVQWVRSTWRGAAQRAGYSDWADVRPDLVPGDVQDAVTVAHWATANPANEWPVCHRSALRAMVANPSSGWVPPLAGHLDRAWHFDEDQVAIGGWARNAIEVVITAHGPLDAVGVLVGSVAPSEWRPDLGEWVGWTTVLDIPSGLPFVCAVEIGSSSDRLLGCALVQ